MNPFSASNSMRCSARACFARLPPSWICSHANSFAISRKRFPEYSIGSLLPEAKLQPLSVEDTCHESQSDRTARCGHDYLPLAAAHSHRLKIRVASLTSASRSQSACSGMWTGGLFSEPPLHLWEPPLGPARAWAKRKPQ